MTLTSRYDAAILTDADGSVLTSWPDLSASNNPAISSAPRAPLVKTNIQNGKRGVLFDGVDDWIHWHQPNADQISRFIAFKWLGNTSNGGGSPRIFDGYECSLAINPSNNSLRLFYWRSASTGDYRTPANSVQANNTYLVEIYRDRNNIAVPPEIWINGVQQTVTTVSVESGIPTTDTFLAFGNVLSNVNGLRSFHGYIFEARFFNTVINSSERASNRSNMLSSWGISGSVKAQSNAASEQVMGNIPEILLSKDTVRGKLDYSGSLIAVRTTTGSSKVQAIGASWALLGKVSKKFARKKLFGSLSMTGSASPELTNLTGTQLEGILNLSGRLIPAIVVSKKHHCKECIKRWAHRWFSRSD